MTTQNASGSARLPGPDMMMERRSSDELNQIRTENQRLKDEAGVLKEELERTRTTRDLLVMKNYELEDRLKHSQKALKEMIEEFLGKRDVSVASGDLEMERARRRELDGIVERLTKRVEELEECGKAHDATEHRLRMELAALADSMRLTDTMRNAVQKRPTRRKT